MDCRRERAEEHIGSGRVRFTVISREYSSSHSSEYGVRISEIGGERFTQRSVAVLAFESDYEIGDELYADAEMYSTDTETLGYAHNFEDGVYVQLVVYEENAILRLPDTIDSPEVILARVRESIGEYMTELFGTDTAALSSALLLGDKSGLHSEQLRDFRRAGVSHLLAVSGLHVSVVIGAIELFLRALLVPRRSRCMLLSLFAIFLLAMTGFASSACRSVLMLGCVYFSYLFVKENDSVTSLFLAVAAIMFVSPEAVRDVGLWMSFLATLGIVAVYIPLSSRAKRPRSKGALGAVLRGICGVGYAMLLTFICNAFVCIVAWLVFGEISLISLISNIVLSPLCEAFIIVTLISCALGGIPLLGTALIWTLSRLGRAIVFLCGEFSGVRGAVISLGYPFAGIIIWLMAFSLAVLLVVKLRVKWHVLISPIAACLAFAICLGGYGFINMGRIKVCAYTDGKNEMLVLSEGYSAAVCDLSSGAYSFTRNSPYIASDSMATEISEYVLTHYHSAQPASLDRLLRETLVRKIFLPYPETHEEYEIMSDIVECAEEQGAELEFYEYGDGISLLGESRLYLLRTANGFGGGHLSISAAVINNGELLSYVNVASDRADVISRLIENSDFVIFGAHGVSKIESFNFDVNTDGVKEFYYTSDEAYVHSGVSHGTDKVNLPCVSRSSFDILLGE